MEPSEERKYSFPNMDQNIPGTSGPLRPENESNFIKPKHVVNIVEALSNSKKDESADVRPIRTYQEDIADVIKNDNVSMIKIALAEKKRQDSNAGFNTIVESNTKSGKTYLIAGIAFVVLVIVGLAFGYIYIQSQTASKQATDVAKMQVPQVIYTEMTSDFSVDNMDSNDIIKSIDQEKNGVMDTGTMKAVYLTTGEGTSTQALTTEQFFSVLGTRIPNSVVKSLDPVFLLGVYAYTPREMFVIFKVKSYDTAFAGMLDWEPNIETDIGNIFISNDSTKSINPLTTSTVSTSTTASSSDLSANPAGTTTPNTGSSLQIFTQKRFVDKVLSNKDTRILQDQSGTPYMLYTFLDKNTLVIATSEKALKEILFRITTGRIIR